MINIVCALFVFSCVHLSTQVSDKKFKLSDLPVLKKWEIPSNHFSKHIGRKYKDLDQERKRSTYWELKPEFTNNELAWDEDPEKVKLDFNYKSFFEDDDDDEVAKKASIPLLNDDSNLTVEKKSILPSNGKDNMTGRKILNKAKQISNKRKHINKHGKRKQIHEVSPRRSRRSLVEEHDGDEVENDKVLTPNFFLVDPTENDAVDDEIRDKRAAIWSAVRRIQSSQYAQRTKKHESGPENSKKRQQIKHSVQYPTPLISGGKQNFNITKKSSIYPKPNNKESVTNHRQKIMSDIENARKTVRNVIQNKKKLKSGELGDEQANEITPSNNIYAVNKPIKDVKAVARQNIMKPKQSSNVDPSNVARAVAMAMEQLKRDKMWGKVFVHVRPSGQLKVMVQETRKMDEESSK